MLPRKAALGKPCYVLRCMPRCKQAPTHLAQHGHKVLQRLHLLCRLGVLYLAGHNGAR